MLLLKLNIISIFLLFFEMGILKGLQGSHHAYIYNPTLFRSVPTYDSAI